MLIVKLMRKSQKPLDEYDGADQIVTSQFLRHKFQRMPPELKVSFRSAFFPSIVEACDGFREGEMIVISGPTKSGKTLLSQSLTYAFAQSNIECLWFSYEMPARQFIESFPEDMFPKFFLPQEIHAQNIDWFEERTLEAWQKYNCRVVFVDHLHFLFDMAKIRSPSLDIGAYVRRIKRFAVKNKLIVFLLTHITKISPDEKLSYSKIRDSSFVPQEADSVFMIRREKHKNHAELSIEFHRRTGVICKTIPLVKRGGYLWEEVPF